ncbi:MAG: ParB N-terminal domain-containing protein [Pseudomonadota bacterium]
MPRAKKVTAVVPEQPEAANDLQQVAPTAIVPIPYARLRRAPENVRQTDIAADVESLADDIAAHGLLQSLIGYPFNKRSPESTIYIVGGGRRLQALALLHERGLIDDGFAVPVLIRGKDEAIELSLSENLARRDMNPADEFTAFAALMAPGTLSVADLAKRFGFTERYVQQRMRLSTLIDEVIVALRAGEITLDAAMAYAKTQDHALQLKIYKAQCKAPYTKHDAGAIGRDIINAQMRTGSGLFEFVGAVDYEAAGGGYEDDLFGDALGYGGTRKVRDPRIVMDLAQPRAELQAAQLLVEAKAKHPCTVAVLLVPGLAGVKSPKPPKGAKLVNRGWNYSWPNYAQLRQRADDLGLAITAIASVKSSGELSLDEQFFVPADRLDELLPKKGDEGSETQAERDARWAADRRQKGIRLLAARMAADANAIARVEGRRFWSDQSYLNNRLDPDLGMCLKLDMAVLVTEAEVDAMMVAAGVDYDAHLAREAENKAAQEKAEADMAVALDERKATLLTASPEPAVLMVDGVWYFRVENGGYWDAVDEGFADQGTDSLSELVEFAETVGKDFDTMDAFRAEFPDVVVPGLEQAA